MDMASTVDCVATADADQNPRLFLNRPTGTADPREWQLLQAQRNLVAAVMTGDASNPYLLRHVDYNDFQGTHDRTQKVMNIHEFLELIRELNASHYPTTRLEVTDEAVDFDVKSDDGMEQAVVWQFMKVIRFEEEIVRNGLRMAKWRQSPRGIWMCYYCAVFRCDPLISADSETFSAEEFNSSSGLS